VKVPVENYGRQFGDGGCVLGANGRGDTAESGDLSADLFDSGKRLDV
jgi:hypothetical protein